MQYQGQSGILCGRATWKDGIQTYAEAGQDTFYEWLETKGIENLNKVRDAVNETAVPWVNFIR
ncbi:hypothetical protein [Metabacillus arenae]|uniref:Uncharacterized protein n=1 Tax=Metabacillus arenae TaxID=2771434 RepID=A0A926NS49_9BACI|nr:hypothetical protein [Metabacillus arenae]MBD1382947.1 hypothetical protein [Metabacillus arenae]